MDWTRFILWYSNPHLLRYTCRYQGAFHHEFFHRDRPEDLDQITRSGPPNLPSKRQAPKRTIQQMKINQNQVENKSDESKVKARKAKLQRRAKHLPANKRLSNRNAENQVPSKPIGLKEKFKAMAATRPTLVWRTWLSWRMKTVSVRYYGASNLATYD